MVELPIIKVRIEGRYRKCELLYQDGNQIAVRILMHELIQGMSDMRTVSIYNVRKADQPIVRAQFPNVGKVHRLTFAKTVIFPIKDGKKIKIAEGKQLNLATFTSSGDCWKMWTTKYGVLNIPKEAVLVESL